MLFELRDVFPQQLLVVFKSVSRTAGDLQNRYENLLDAVCRISMFGGFCYTQFTDTFQEANGLFFADRTPKFDLAEMREATHGRKGPQQNPIAVTSSTEPVIAAHPSSGPLAGTAKDRDADH